MAKKTLWQARVTLEGITPTLMHKCGIIETKVHNPTTDWSDEWKATVYVDKEGRCIVPSLCIEAMMKNAARGEKVGKAPLNKIIASGCDVEEFEVPFFVTKNGSLSKDKKFDPKNNVQPTVDMISQNKWLFTCSVVIQKKRVNRTRACFDPGWNFSFTLSVSDPRLKPDFMEEFLNRAGTKEGWWNWRPGAPKPGKFGQFEVAQFEVL